jgi:hypothetical protein
LSGKFGDGSTIHVRVDGEALRFDV